MSSRIKARTFSRLFRKSQHQRVQFCLVDAASFVKELKEVIAMTTVPNGLPAKSERHRSAVTCLRTGTSESRRSSLAQLP